MPIDSSQSHHPQYLSPDCRWFTSFVPRKGAEFSGGRIAKTLTGEYDKSRRILVAEAGTGIGKSLSYAQGAIPVAQTHQKKLVISTATVALRAADPQGPAVLPSPQRAAVSLHAGQGPPALLL